MTCSKLYFSFQNWIDSKKEFFSMKLEYDRLNREVKRSDMKLDDYKRSLENYHLTDEDKDGINELVFISTHNLCSLRFKMSELGNEIENYESRFSKFCGLLKNQYGKYEGIYIPEGMEFEPNSPHIVCTNKEAGIYEVVMISSDNANLFSDEIVSPLEKTAEVVSPPEKTAEVISPLEETVEVISPLEKTVEVVSPEKNIETSSQKSFSDALKKNIDNIPPKKDSDESIDVSQLKEHFLFEKPLSLSEKSSQKKKSHFEPLSERRKKQLHGSFEEKVRKVVFNHLEKGSKRGCNISHELKKLISEDQYNEFFGASCYHTNERSFDTWKEVGLKPPLISIKKILNHSLEKSGFYLLTRSDDPKNTSLCPEGTAKHLGATEENLGTL